MNNGYGIGKRQSFIPLDKKVTISSYKDYFFMGEKVAHQDKETGEAIITSFDVDISKNEVRVTTDKEFAYLNFLEKLENHNGTY